MSSTKTELWTAPFFIFDFALWTAQKGNEGCLLELWSALTSCSEQHQLWDMGVGKKYFTLCQGLLHSTAELNARIKAVNTIVRLKNTSRSLTLIYVSLSTPGGHTKYCLKFSQLSTVWRPHFLLWHEATLLHLPWGHTTSWQVTAQGLSLDPFTSLWHTDAHR